MWPIVTTLADTPVSSYLVFVALGWFVGGVTFYRAFRRFGWPLEQMLFVMAGCLFGALFGSALGSLMFLPPEDALARTSSGHVFVGNTFVGGVLGGFVGVELAKKLVGYPHSTGDAFALAIPLGHALGRLGCLCAGCCFGTPSTLPWAIRYPLGSPAHAAHVSSGLLSPEAKHSLPVHPAPLYELGFDLLLLLALWLLRPYLRERGSLFRAYLIGYASFRFLIELVRGDSVVPEGYIFKPVQWVLLAMVLLAGFRLFGHERTRRSQTLI